jgi:hypothetical protein
MCWSVGGGSGGASGCKTVGLAYVGSNPTPATTSEDGPWPGVSPGFAGRRAFCHPRSAAVRRHRCTTVVTDIWRTDPGLEERFTAPLALFQGGGLGSGPGSSRGPCGTRRRPAPAAAVRLDGFVSVVSFRGCVLPPRVSVICSVAAGGQGPCGRTVMSHAGCADKLLIKPAGGPGRPGHREDMS